MPADVDVSSVAAERVGEDRSGEFERFGGGRDLAIELCRAGRG
jgi:hypothetical protein